LIRYTVKQVDMKNDGLLPASWKKPAALVFAGESFGEPYGCMQVRRKGASSGSNS